MKLRQLLPVVLMFVGASAFASHKEIIRGTHHLMTESKKLVGTFQHNLAGSDKRQLIRDARLLAGAVNHFNRIWHKKLLGITIGHRHKKHAHMMRDFARVKRAMSHLKRRFYSTTRRPHHVKKAVSHLRIQYRNLHGRIHRHAS